MKTTIKSSVLLIACILLAAGLSAQGIKHYKINGTVKGVPDGTSFYLIKTDATNGGPDTIGRVQSKKSAFAFSGKLESEGELFFVKMDTTKIKITNKKISWVRLMLDRSNISIVGAVIEWPNVMINGSPVTSEYEALKKIQLSRREQIKNLNKDSILQLRAITDYKKFLLSYSSSHSNSFSAAFALFDPLLKEERLSEINNRESAYNNLTDKVKKSFYGNKVRKEIEEAKTRLRVQLGRQTPQLSAKTIDGREFDVEGIIKKSKYTLIDFWASWCTACKEDVPYLQAAYDKYHSKGLSIISLAVLDNNSNWQNAMKKVTAPWPHGIENNKDISGLFGLRSLPAFLLIDQEGKLLVFSCGLSLVQPFGGPIRGDDLDKKLAEVFSIGN